MVGFFILPNQVLSKKNARSVQKKPNKPSSPKGACSLETVSGLAMFQGRFTAGITLAFPQGSQPRILEFPRLLSRVGLTDSYQVHSSEDVRAGACLS